MQDVESLTVYDPGSGKILRCSRTENADRFARVVGGLGLFGVITDMTLRLVPRQLQQRRTEYAPADEAVARLDAAAVRGATHGDFQYVVDETDPDFMRAGLVMTYEPAEAGAEPGPLLQDAALFTKLAVLAHADRPAGWLAYKRQVLAPSPVAAWSDQWQMATYAHGYHREVERATGMPRGSEILSELFVPRDQLAAHLEASAAAIRRAGVPLIYGNVRLIEPDRETALPWARGRFACVVSNLHADHTPAGLGGRARRLPRHARRRAHPRRHVLPRPSPLRPPRPSACRLARPRRAPRRGDAARPPPPRVERLRGGVCVRPSRWSRRRPAA